MHRRALLLLYPIAILAILATAQEAANQNVVEEDLSEQAADGEQNPDFHPGTFAVYVAELIGTIAGLIWGLYASLPTFG